MKPDYETESEHGQAGSIAGILFAVTLGVFAVAACYAAGVLRMLDAVAEVEHLHDLTMID